MKEEKKDSKKRTQKDYSYSFCLLYELIRSSHYLKVLKK